MHHRHPLRVLAHREAAVVPPGFGIDPVWQDDGHIEKVVDVVPYLKNANFTITLTVDSKPGGS